MTAGLNGLKIRDFSVQRVRPGRNGPRRAQRPGNLSELVSVRPSSAARRKVGLKCARQRFPWTPGGNRDLQNGSDLP